MQGLYAETDSSGDVIWVWLKERRDAVARPVIDASRLTGAAAELPCYGASKEAIKSWLESAVVKTETRP